MEKINLEIRLTPDDMISVSDFISQQNYPRERRRTLITIGLLSATMLCVFALKADSILWEAAFYIILLFLGIFIFSFILSSIFLPVAKLLRKRYLQKAFSKISSSVNSTDQSTRYVFSEEGIEIKYESNKNLISWNEITELLEIPTAFLLLNSHKQIDALFPKRCFSDAQETNFRNLVSNKLGNKAIIQL